MKKLIKAANKLIPVNKAKVCEFVKKCSTFT